MDSNKNSRKININGRRIEYVFRRTKRSKSVRLAIYQDGRFVVSAPKWYPIYAVNKFIEEKSDWIFERVKNIDFDFLKKKKEIDDENYKKHISLARVVIKDRLEFFNQYYNFQYKRISIKNQKTCWGSCSQKANLNFNYKIVLLTEDLRDYVIVHELCHLQELNHGPKFWQLVSIAMPNYQENRKKLKNLAY